MIPLLRVLASPGYNARRENPYTHLLYSSIPATIEDYSVSRSLLHQYDIAHFHWPEEALNYSESTTAASLRLARQFAVIDMLRLRGTRVLWTVHNLNSHERKFPKLEHHFWNSFTRRLDGYIALSNYGKQAALGRFPQLHRIPGFVVPHGHYRDSYVLGGRDSRDLLNISRGSAVILHLGWIRPYKNVPRLIRTFRSMKRDDAILIIAGRPSTEELRREIEHEAASDPRIRLELAHISEDSVSRYIAAADLIALPYKDILNSGTALLGLSLNKPVLVPKLGALNELATDIGGDWVSCYQGDLTSEVLGAALLWATKTNRAHNAPVDHLGWRVIAEQTLTVYRTVIASTRVRAQVPGHTITSPRKR